MKYSYPTKYICPSQINFELDGQTVKNISFKGGCNGNLKAIAKLLDGQSVDYIEISWRGPCGMRTIKNSNKKGAGIRHLLFSVYSVFRKLLYPL